jgi:hypothetical protein
MPWPVHPNGLLGAQGDNDTYQISRSLRFNAADSAYLNRTPASSGNTQKFTYSAWVKIASTATSQEITLLGAGTGAQTNLGNDLLQLRGNGTGLQIGLLGQGGVGGNYSQFTAYHRDPSSWQHVIVSVDTTQATQANRCRAYFNGVEETSAVNNTFGSAYNFNYLNTTAAHLIGRGNEGGGPSHTDAYLTEINFIDGQALTPSSFGETDAVTGRWKAKAYSGTYGTNGFYLKFADNSSTAALGTDSSGNGNTWTTNNFSVTAGVGNDSLVDSPTNYGGDSYNTTVDNSRGNYNTFNLLSKVTTATLTNGNLDAGASAIAIGSIGMSSGKWYWEITSTGGATAVGMYGASATSTRSVASGATEGFRFDSVAGTLDYTTNGSTFTSIATGLASIPYFIYVSTAAATTASLNCGQRLFAYTMPSGYKTLCTTNLTTPTIKKPSSYMDVVTYTGTGASNSISSLGFSPDLVWIKNRGGATSHALYDTVRGVQAQLSSDTTGTEVTSSTGLTAFSSNGFTIGTSSLVNTSGTQYVAWAWDAGESSVTNNSGSITSTVRANPQNGVSVVSATMPNLSSPRTVGHGLGVAPKMIIAKFRSAASNWNTYHSSLGATKIIFINSTDASVSDVTRWNNTEPTSSVFTLGSQFVPDASSNTLIAYCFAEIEGFSKIGSYTGNGSADGPFVYCGFRPRWILFKESSASGNNWSIYDTSRDTANPEALQLRASTSDAEVSNTFADYTSNGFKVRVSTDGINFSGRTYIFAAFAEQPFKYARAR